MHRHWTRSWIGPVLTQAACALFGGYLVDRFPLRPVAVIAMAGVAVTVVPGFLVIIHFRALAAAIVGQAVWAGFLGVAYTVATVSSMRLFPVAVRFTATAIAVNLASSLFGGTAPYVSTILMDATGSPLAPGAYLLVAILGGLLAVTIGGAARHQPTSAANTETVGTGSEQPAGMQR